MRLIKLTNAAKGPEFIHVSADHIISVIPENGYTLIETSRSGLYHRVRESPEAIESLANSTPEQMDFRSLLKFVEWYRDNQSRFYGKTYHQMVNAFISENWNG